jgi:hypothetical protein
VVVEWGGANGQGNLYFNRCGASLSNAVVRNSSRYGIYQTGTPLPTLSNISYSNNESGNTN